MRKRHLACLAEVTIMLSCLAGFSQALAVNTTTMTEPRAQVSMIVPYAPEQVWRLVSNPKLLTQEEPKVRKIRLLSRTNTYQDVAYQVSLSKLLPDFQYVLHYEIKPANYLMTFRRVKGSFKDIQGYWHLVPVANGKQTRITYSLAIDPGFMAPPFLIKQAIKSDLPSMMRHVRLALDKTLQTQAQLPRPVSNNLTLNN